ncbi:NfeD family protein [Maricurvus nonylphenolicus]|uniref:NfeD family protein n=1 Tax=Maricurvus nonylphenolicus TaxID=1008307 RepID=UPI0036F27D04
MFEVLSQLESWHWLSLGILLLLGEVLGAGGFLLGIGIGALCVALMMTILPGLSWQAQLMWFGILSIVSTLVYWKRFRAINQATDQPLLNNRAARLVGRKVELLEAVVNGKGKVQIEDALWTVLSDEDIDSGKAVEIVGVDGMSLKVRPL